MERNISVYECDHFTVHKAQLNTYPLNNNGHTPTGNGKLLLWSFAYCKTRSEKFRPFHKSYRDGTWTTWGRKEYR